MIALFKFGVASYENPTQEEGELDYPTLLYSPSPQRSQCNQWTKTQNQSRILDFPFFPHICIQQNLKKTPPKSLLNNLAWNVYPLTKKHKITRKYKVLKPFPEPTVACTVCLFCSFMPGKTLGFLFSTGHREIQKTLSSPSSWEWES